MTILPVNAHEIPGPFTPARLLDIAIETTDTRLKHQALFCGAWMEKHGHKEFQYVGPFGVLPPVGRVRIKKGTRFWTTHPSVGKSNGGNNHKIAGRTYDVDVWRMSHGYVDIGFGLGPEGEVRQPTITWAGAGGYWCEVPLTEVEIVK